MPLWAREGSGRPTSLYAHCPWVWTVRWHSVYWLADSGSDECLWKEQPNWRLLSCIGTAMLRPGKPSGPRSACTLAVTLLERLKRARLQHRNWQDGWETFGVKSFQHKYTTCSSYSGGGDSYSLSWVGQIFFHMTHQRSNVTPVDSVFIMPRVATSTFLHPLPSEEVWLTHVDFSPLPHDTNSLDDRKRWGPLLISANHKWLETCVPEFGMLRPLVCMGVIPVSNLGYIRSRPCRGRLVDLINHAYCWKKMRHSWNKLFLGSSCDVWLIAEWSHKSEIRHRP